jgi:hypothetical protein
MEKGRMPLCYDARRERHVGMVRESFFMFRYAP